MKSSIELKKALLLLDYGKLDKGRAQLENIILQAENENDFVILVRALVCLGDLLFEVGSLEDAKIYLNKALSYKVNINDDLLDYEFSRASELLLKLA
ncbi:hypothetical protein [Escherichia ruysiae]|uniref:hypothetical protein n=1 Tax=Escherichia ruysiae TaxID=2608867 RepID=UPI003F4A9CA4